ncbi:MAG: hypothetical protein M1833_000131 [Piccolia ochrophora]|nr:MAG: hypothetical protein M1833_000131 [Piccolia ochrophora]
MTEDEAYRSSTQYRLWSFAPTSLASLRATTNDLAAHRVRAAIRRAREARSNGDLTPDVTGDGSSSNDAGKDGVDGMPGSGELDDIDCLTVDEDLKLVGYYCAKAMDLADFCSFPTNVKATAVQYLKRFYLSNSPMTYHPKLIMPCALFLATKTENHYTPLSAFAAKFGSSPEDVIAPELLVVQGLRFSFDVRHPFRALEGGFMELLAMAAGTPGLARDRPADELRTQLRGLPPAKTDQHGAEKPQDVVNRIRTAHGRAKDVLKTAALLTDAYFLATPAHVWLAALLAVDAPLARFYVDAKVPQEDVHAKLLATLEPLAALLADAPSSTTPGKEEVREAKRIDKKLFYCSNPEKEGVKGAVAAGARKRDGEGEGSEEERARKKRKEERERGQREGEGVFGGPLAK